MKAREARLKQMRDWYSVFETAIKEAIEKETEIRVEKGIQIGVEIGIKMAALQMIREGFPDETIVKITNLPHKVIERLRKR